MESESTPNLPHRTNNKKPGATSTGRKGNNVAPLYLLLATPGIIGYGRKRITTA